MGLITKKLVQPAVYWVEVPEIDIKLLCACPADIVKHLSQQSLLPLTQKDGRTFESGPNAVLLSDQLFQNEMLSNLSEFPLLHMLYKQGMIIPNHPNNTNQKPILIGKTEQLKAQMDYFYRGNFGLVSEEEYTQLGETAQFAKENISYKLNFAFGDFLRTDQLLDCIPLEDQEIEIHSGFYIKRTALNRFTLSYKGDSIEVDLNLKKGESYKTSYKLPPAKIPEALFAVIHTGEGDGWDPNRPCLGSIVVYDGKAFLIDTGPQIRTTLEAFDLQPENLGGIFFTHVHDDHFAGLCSIINKKYKIKIFATRVVYKTVLLKLAALTSIPEEELSDFFTYHELMLGDWNHYGDLEIKPILSPHPTDTTILIFRAMDNDGYKTYGHFSDITALKSLKKMIVEDFSSNGILESQYKKLVEIYKMPLDLKKSDVGGAPIHGEATDFINDPSKKLVLSHTSSPLNRKQLAVGIQAKFAETDILVRSKPSK
ncbi:MAG: MBL fold metallo-hydrolase [Deltaproteobacteria bacterium]|nr:MBL fold metallo-hydrolase [Deltaproteobacteria bacterium]